MKTLWSKNRNDIRPDQKEQSHKGGGDPTDKNIGRARPAISPVNTLEEDTVHNKPYQSIHHCTVKTVEEGPVHNNRIH